MPLLNHFHPPLSRTHPWRSFHGAWAAAMARLLNQGVLPPGYYAVPFLDRNGPIEIDVAALQTSALPETTGELQPWAAPAPGISVAVDWPETDDIRVEILTDDGDPRLAAAVDLPCLWGRSKRGRLLYGFGFSALRFRKTAATVRTRNRFASSRSQAFPSSNDYGQGIQICSSNFSQRSCIRSATFGSG